MSIFKAFKVFAKMVGDKQKEKREESTFCNYQTIDTRPLIGEANSKIIHRPKTKKLFKNL